MVFRLHLRPRRLLAVLGVGALLLFAASLVLELLPELLRSHRQLAILEIDEKLGVATWYSALLFAICAVLVVAISQQEQPPSGRTRWHWRVLAALLGLLSLSKPTSAHKVALDLARHLSERLGFTVPRLAFGVLLLVVLTLVYLRFLLSLEPRVRRALLLAGGVYLVGLVVLDMAGGLAWHRWGGDSAAYVVTSNLEELTEMAGAILLARGFLLHYRRIVPERNEATR